MWFFKIVFIFQFSPINQTKGLRFFSHDHATAALAVPTQWMDIPSVRQHSTRKAAQWPGADGMGSLGDCLWYTIRKYLSITVRDVGEYPDFFSRKFDFLTYAFLHLYVDFPVLPKTLLTCHLFWNSQALSDQGFLILFLIYYLMCKALF